jgi:hypothetical protein
MGATRKYVPKRKKVCFGANADLLQTKSVPKLYCFAIFLRTFLRNICTKEVGINWYKIEADVTEEFGIIGQSYFRIFSVIQIGLGLR